MPPAEGNLDDVHRVLERILLSTPFARSEQLSRLLQFLMERHLAGRDQELKESVIGVEVFGREPEYDSKRDPIVRTGARRLRARLTEYYAGPGKSDPIIIDLPKGGYLPVIRAVEVESDRVRQTRFGWSTAGVATLIVVVLAVGWMRFGPPTAPIPIAVLPLA